MRMTKKQLFIGTPLALVVGVAIAFLAVWAWGVGPLGGDDSHVKVNVEYTIRDASGLVKAHGLLHNAVVDVTRNDAIDGFRTGTSAAYDKVELCKTMTAVSTGTSTATVCTTVDNGAATVGANPVVGTVSALDTTTNVSSYTVTKAFTIGATGTTIAEIHLGKGAVTAGVVIAAGSIGAYRVLTATLTSGDTITIVWKVTIT